MILKHVTIVDKQITLEPFQGNWDKSYAKLECVADALELFIRRFT